MSDETRKINSAGGAEEVLSPFQAYLRNQPITAEHEQAMTEYLRDRITPPEHKPEMEYACEVAEEASAAIARLVREKLETGLSVADESELQHWRATKRLSEPIAEQYATRSAGLAIQRLFAESAPEYPSQSPAKAVNQNTAGPLSPPPADNGSACPASGATSPVPRAATRGPKPISEEDRRHVAEIVNRVAPDGDWLSKLDDVGYALDHGVCNASDPEACSNTTEHEKIPLPRGWKQKGHNWLSPPDRPAMVKAIKERLKRKAQNPRRNSRLISANSRLIPATQIQSRKARFYWG